MTDSRLILIRENNKILSMLLSSGRLVEMNAFAASDPTAVNPDSVSSKAGFKINFPLGSIYVGKVKNVVKNINAAFVELAPGHNAFLPLEGVKSASLLNRKFDGRILAGDELLVQISREAVKTKDPVLTTSLSLSGRYAVVEADCSSQSEFRKRIHFSAKMAAASRRAIQDYLEGEGNDALLPVLEHCTVIIRTNAAQLQTLAAIQSEILELGGRLRRILEVADHRTCYSCLYQPVSPWLTEIRDTYSNQYDEIVTDDESLYHALSDFLKNQYPEELGRLRFYQDERVSLKNLYGLTAKIQEATEPRIWLKSGGYLVIEPTEALTVIDVNSGKYSGKKGTSETWKLINREAAEEIARQLRLRNFSGIIIADFINMDTKEDEEELLAFLSSELKKDPVKTAVIDMTPLGLVEITRKKIRKSLKEQLEV